MKTIGIVGAENTHSAAIARTLNVTQAVPGFEVGYLWGETEELAAATAEKGRIPNIVATPTDMLGHIDAVIVDHRHGGEHLAAARPFLDAGIPMFIDKPFCYRSDEGAAFLAEARRKHVPVTSFSTLPLQQTFLELQAKAATLGPLVGGAFFGPADLESPYGGVFFYGSHQVEMAVALCGADVKAVLVSQNAECSTGQLFYASGMTITLHFFKKTWVTFNAAIMGSDGIANVVIQQDADMYLAGIRAFTGMFATGKEPCAHDAILAPVRILEALERSVQSGDRERVGDQASCS